MKSIDLSLLQSQLKSGSPPAVVEALPEKYFRDWHLPGALHMPHDQVIELAPRLLPDQNRPVVVYCASATCQNSQIAARLLDRLGYRDVSVFVGGKQAWSEAGLPVERESVAA